MESFEEHQRKEFRRGLDELLEGSQTILIGGVMERHDTSRWSVTTIEEAEACINVLHRRSIRDKNEIDILTAKLDLLTTPRWNPRARKRAKRWIAVLTEEASQDVG